MTLHGVVTADAYYLCSRWASFVTVTSVWRLISNGKFYSWPLMQWPTRPAQKANRMTCITAAKYSTLLWLLCY